MTAPGLSLAELVEQVLIAHQRRDIKGCGCGTWGSDHGHLGQSHAGHLLAELRRAGLTVVRAPEPDGTSMTDRPACACGGPCQHDGSLARERAYQEGRWCGECRYGVVEDPPCCTRDGGLLPIEVGSGAPHPVPCLPGCSCAGAPPMGASDGGEPMAVTLRSPEGELGTIVGPADKLAELVRPGAVVDRYGRQGPGPFCEQTWSRPGWRLLVCQRGPRHVAEGRPHKDPSGLLWSDAERAAGAHR